MEKKRIPGVWILIGCAGAVALVLALFGLFQFRAMQTEVKRLQSVQQISTVASQEQVQTETALLVETIGTLTVLPTGETPTVATVTDMEKLKGQDFFLRAIVGDKVLIYPNAKFAVLYRPSEKKVVTAATVTVGTGPTGSPIPTPPLTPSPAPAPPAKSENPSFFLLNGTGTVGLTKKMETELMRAYPKASVVDFDNAKKRTYTTSFLVDMRAKKDDTAKSIAASLKLELSDLPSAEATSGGTYEYIIIVVEDKK
jgi:hypothetical protein